MITRIPSARRILSRRIPVFAGGILGIFLLVGFCFSGVVFAYVREDPEQISWNLSARVVEYSQEQQMYIATEDVVIEGGKTRLEADYVQYSDVTKEAFVQGNVTLVSGEDILSCDSMRINLATEQGVVEKGSLFVQKNHMYVEAENLRKTGQFTYSAQEGSITSCKGDLPDWKITGKNIRVTVNGYGIVSHAAFRIRGVPALYLPFLVFPVKNERQTGLLSPVISHSNRHGFSYDQPLFLALSRNTDLTFFADYMSDRGVKTGARFRYVLNPYARGTIFFDFLEDAKEDDGTQDYGFAATPQRTNDDRYWFRMKADQNLPLGIKAMLDLDIVSDADYLREFPKGHSGYDRGQSYFENEYGRQLDTYSQTLRRNTLTLYRSKNQFSFAGQAVWYDDVIARQHSEQDTTLQTLPALSFDIAKTPWQDTGFYYTLDTQFSSFYREDTTASQIRGHRVDLYPRLYYPMRLNQVFFLEPFVGVRTTAWHANDFVSLSGDRDTVMTRVLPKAGVVLSTTLSRVFAVDRKYVKKLRHEISPGLFYEYVPDRDQDDLPLFDPLDRLDERNAIGWSLTQTITAKRTRTRKTETGETQSHVYEDLAWMKISQEYDFSGQEDPFDGKDRSWSDLRFEVQMKPTRFWSLDGDFSVCPYSGDFQKVHLGTNWKNTRGDSFISGYRYSRKDFNPLETWYNEVHIHLTSNLDLYGILEQDLYAGKTVETKVGFSLKRFCWSIDVQFSESSGNQHIGVLVSLAGLGQLGNRGL